MVLQSHTSKSKNPANSPSGHKRCTLQRHEQICATAATHLVCAKAEPNSQPGFQSQPVFKHSNGCQWVRVRVMMMWGAQHPHVHCHGCWWDAGCSASRVHSNESQWDAFCSPSPRTLRWMLVGPGCPASLCTF